MKGAHVKMEQVCIVEIDLMELTLIPSFSYPGIMTQNSVALLANALSPTLGNGQVCIQNEQTGMTIHSIWSRRNWADCSDAESTNR
jgi:hypothetical protein